MLILFSTYSRQKNITSQVILVHLTNEFMPLTLLILFSTYSHQKACCLALSGGKCSPKPHQGHSAMVPIT
jgi:hypothetical protein